MKPPKEPNRLSGKASDLLASFVGTWHFVFAYTFGMGIWIALHKLEILHIDSQDFMRWNLWLSYFAGIQASILLMSANRAAERVQQTTDSAHNKTLETTEETNEMIKTLEQDIEELAGVIESLVRDEITQKQEKINDTHSNPNL